MIPTRIACQIGLIALILSGTSTAGEPPTGAVPEGEVSPKEFVEWVRETAIPVERWTMSPALEAYLERALRGRRIIFLGEPGHFFQEKYDVQLMLIELLARKGYRHLFIEGLGATASAIVDEFVSTEVAVAAPAADASDEERYRARVLEHAVGPDASVFQRRRAGGQRRFFEALRRLNESRPEGVDRLTVHPLDVDMAPGGCRLTIDALLANYDMSPGLQALRQRCARGPEEPVDRWFGRLEQVRDTIDADPDAELDGLSAPDRHRLRQCIDCLVESLAFTLTRKADGVMDRALVRREPAMFRQAQAALERLPDDAKVIMMAHCNHLSRVGADTMRARRPSLGEMIAAEHPGEVFSIWMLHDHGWLLNPMAPEPLEELRSDPERVESLLVRAGSTFVLPLHTGARPERYLDRKRRLSYFSWYETATLTVQADALFFLDEITPLEE
jgi:erythromycin esterase-like protein